MIGQWIELLAGLFKQVHTKPNNLKMYEPPQGSDKHHRNDAEPQVHVAGQVAEPPTQACSAQPSSWLLDGSMGGLFYEFIHLFLIDLSD